MEKEKVLSFLNIDLKKSIDKFMMKLITWFYVGFSVFIFGGGLLLKLISFSWYNILAFSLCVISIIALFITIKTSKKHTDEWFHHFSAVSCSVLVLLYGWAVFSKGELIEFGYPRFGWMHIAVSISAVALAVYMLVRFFRVYKITMNHSIEKAKSILLSQNKGGMSIPAALAVSPMIFVRLLSGPFSELGLGIGLCLWALMCIWLMLAVFMLPKIIVILKYKVYQWQT
ncbi:MAG: hypothetical protein E7627_03435 [Ruminococcaceae bacterium]|nr:hypothetical protein [Oscillospiraceae bacterium]